MIKPAIEVAIFMMIDKANSEHVVRKKSCLLQITIYETII